MSRYKTHGEHAAFGGTLGYYEHDSRETKTPMRFAVYQPPQAAGGKCPALYYLAGLTCTEETFVTKGGALGLAAELGLVLVAPDTSPRGAKVPGESDSWDFGLGAGFYVDATQAPWDENYRMYSYVTEELFDLVSASFPVDTARVGIFGHSMGGHGALVMGLRAPDKYRSVSAFAPVAAPMQSPWGKKAFGNYLGPDEAAWRAYDASVLVTEHRHPGTLLVDQGLADKFMMDQLYTEAFLEACKAAGQKAEVRMHERYDHSYFFISTFMGDHLRHHAAALGR